MDDSIHQVTTEVVLLPRPRTAAVGGGLAARTQFATVVCSVVTEGGVRGESYVSFESIEQARGLAAVLSDAGQALAGRDALARREAEQVVARHLHELLAREGLARIVLSLVDIALWDLFGKVTGLPVWRLIGGGGTDVRCYASHGLFAGETEDQLEESAQRLVADGFRGLKLRVGRRPVSVDVARAKRVRAAVGPEVSIMVDGLWSMRSGDAIRFGRAVEELDIGWLEDPTPEGNLAELKRVRDNVTIPVASAERVSSAGEFRRLLDAEAVDVAIVDVYHVGGVSSWLECAALANDRGVTIAGHAAPAYSAHLVSAVENGEITEYFPWWDDLQGGAMKPSKGLFSMTSAPGWGMPLDPTAMDTYRETMAQRTRRSVSGV